MISNHEKLQREYSTLNEDLTKCRIDLEQIEKSDIYHKEQVNTILIHMIHNKLSVFS